MTFSEPVQLAIVGGLFSAVPSTVAVVLLHIRQSYKLQVIEENSHSAMKRSGETFNAIVKMVTPDPSQAAARYIANPESPTGAHRIIDLTKGK